MQQCHGSEMERKEERESRGETERCREEDKDGPVYPLACWAIYPPRLFLVRDITCTDVYFLFNIIELNSICLMELKLQTQNK
uniref:Uncharacterized protein n=1 Tax=Neolamprologus brichardi TaxID=32507 RepID=A0A3Q4GHF6_NEOBR